MADKPIRFSRHAAGQMIERGATEADVIAAVRSGERVAAKKDRVGCRKNFPFGRTWGGRTYAIKQVLAIVADDPNEIVVITVYTFYF